MNLTFRKSFPYSPGLSSVLSMELHSIILPIPPRISVYLVNVSLFLSIEAKKRTYFHFFSSMYPSASPITKYKEFSLLIVL